MQIASPQFNLQGTEGESLHPVGESAIEREAELGAPGLSLTEAPFQLILPFFLWPHCTASGILVP